MKGISENLFRLQTLDSAGKSNDPAQAAGLRASIPPGILTNYDRARARRKKGIALVRNNVCMNCRIQVPIAVTATLLRGAIQVCGNCGLYLYLPEPEQLPMSAGLASPSEVTPRRKKRALKTSPSND